MDHTNGVTRRTFFRTAGLLGAAVATSGLAGFSSVARASDAPAVNIDELIAKQVGAGPIAMEKVALDIPATAENAALVRMPITVDHPMEANNFIQSVILVIDNNPNPLVAQFELLPESGKVSLEFRARMAKSSKVRVIAKSNSGKLYGLVKDIQVAAGGCAG
ncbi:MAG: hypothetical protein HQM06_00130 [Magnetococcales bacterium]|nr:hypothetical protein [Magnetococcales bacterium]